MQTVEYHVQSGFPDPPIVAADQDQSKHVSQPYNDSEVVLDADTPQDEGFWSSLQGWDGVESPNTANDGDDADEEAAVLDYEMDISHQSHEGAMQDDSTGISVLGHSDEWYPWHSREVSRVCTSTSMVIKYNLITGYHTRRNCKYPTLGVFKTTNRNDVLVFEDKWCVSPTVSKDIAQSKWSAAQYVWHSHR